MPLSPMIGLIKLFPYDFAPAGWIFCHGQDVPIDESKDLYEMIEFTFGGGGDKFRMPDLRQVAPPNCHYCVASKGTNVTFDGALGETFLKPEYYMPSNLMKCSGQSLDKSKYADLERHIGTRFGGGPTSFKLPDLQPKNPDYLSYVMTVIGWNPELIDGYLGELRLLPFELSRTDYQVLCDGRGPWYRQVQPELYNLLGSRFGGNDREFYLPVLRSSAPSQFNYYMNIQAAPPPKS